MIVYRITRTYKAVGLTAMVWLIFGMNTGAHAQVVHSLGLYTGITAPYTYDEGMNKDPRYLDKYKIKFAPIGFHYGIDYPGYGFTFDPGLFQTGMDYNVINTVGGQVGERNVRLTYAQVPVGFKLHMIDLGFFKVSFVASVSAALLLSGEETISHDGAILKFHPNVIPNLPPTYTPTFPGSTEVISPVVKELKVLETKNYNRFQVYGAIGFRSDWDIREDVRLSFDVRGSYGILEPRNTAYLDKVKNYEAIYDLYGPRKDLLVMVTMGISRTVELDPKEQRARTKKKQENKPHRPSKYPWPGPRNKKPKG